MYSMENPCTKHFLIHWEGNIKMKHFMGFYKINTHKTVIFLTSNEGVN